jgi:hypothetical protein
MLEPDGHHMIVNSGEKCEQELRLDPSKCRQLVDRCRGQTI